MKNTVVITGIGINSCLGANKKETLDYLLSDRSGITDLTIINTDEFETHVGGEVSVPNDREKERSLVLAEMAIGEAIVDSKLNENMLTKAALLYGTCNGGICSIENCNIIEDISEDRLERYIFSQNADTLAKEFNIQGTVQTFNTACAASGLAIGMGYDLIKLGRNDLIIAGGADAMSKAVYAGFSSLQSLSNQPCAPYDVNTGLSLGEGAAFLVLENKEHALKRGAHIYAELKGYGLSNDAHHPTAPDPKGGGVEKAVESALHNSEVNKEDITYINTHGTGTLANDGAELSGLKTIFGKAVLDSIAVSSSKSYFGHNLGAAAALELSSTLLLMERGYLPATLNHTETRQDCQGVNLIFNEKRSIKKGSQNILVNNSAFAGYNCSIVCSLYDDKKEVKSADVQQERKKIYINDYSYISEFYSVNLNGGKETFVDPFNLKGYKKHLYSRRMNTLSQYAIGAVSNLSLFYLDNQSIDDIGFVFGTRYGSLESSAKYLSSIWNKGFDRASSIYFPDMVLNSTGGKVHSALGFRGYASTISTGGNEFLATISDAYFALQSNVSGSLIAGSGEEKSNFEKYITTSVATEEWMASPYFECVEVSDCNDSWLEILDVYQGFVTADHLPNIIKEKLSECDVIINLSKSFLRIQQISEMAKGLEVIAYEELVSGVFEYISGSSYDEFSLIDITENGNCIILKLKKGD